LHARLDRMSTIAESEGLPTGESTIVYDTLPYDFITAIQRQFQQKIYNPQTDPDATDKLTATHRAWQSSGAITVFTTGVYDMLHPDHTGYLLHTKAAGAAVHYAIRRYRRSWEELNTLEQQIYTRRILGEQQLRLVVSVDGNRSVSERKGGKAEKGGGVRPIYDWQTRALMVASQTFIDPDDMSSERLLPTVDAVTIHGPHDLEATSPHADMFQLAAVLRPNVWTIFGESTDILEEVHLRPELGKIALRCIRSGEGTHYYEDPIMGKMSTTKIVQRITGT
jgi:hypothetical protein